MKSTTTIENENSGSSFRDSLATVDASGKRKWVYAQKPSGRFYNLRTYLSWIFFVVFVSLPFISVRGRPLFMFNIPNARFIIFGKVFWPQDFFIFGLTMITFVIFIILFTAAFGRLFCGWICPQTIFLEMLFRKIEWMFDGNPARQKLLKASPWNTQKIIRRTSKHAVFFLLSFLIANLFLSYIIGVKQLGKIISEPPSAHVIGLLSILVFSFVFYAVYAYFREQACTVVCPYGRLQGVLLDKNSMIVAYDYKRGEKRARYSRDPQPGTGDCIDCFQCVKVCPTAIDIRNGTQMECVACTACIDACNHMMEEIGRPRGLIRYASETGIANGESLKYTTRMKLYTGLLGVLIVILCTLLMTRKDVDATIIRTPGMLYQMRGTDSISNLFNIKIANKTVHDIPLQIKLEDMNGNVEIIGHHEIMLKKEDEGSGSFFVVLPKDILHHRKMSIQIGLYQDGQQIDMIKTNFLGPMPDSEIN